MRCKKYWRTYKTFVNENYEPSNQKRSEKNGTNRTRTNPRRKRTN